jgi:hypothetical protein
MTMREACGYVFCTAGMGLGVFTWYQLIHWGWGILAVLLFLLGFRLLRGRPDDDAHGDISHIDLPD